LSNSLNIAFKVHFKQITGTMQQEIFCKKI